MADYYKDLIKLLQDRGCYFVRAGKGNHEIWHSPASGKNFTIPRTSKSRHMASEVLKQAGFEKVF